MKRGLIARRILVWFFIGNVRLLVNAVTFNSDLLFDRKCFFYSAAFYQDSVPLLSESANRLT